GASRRCRLRPRGCKITWEPSQEASEWEAPLPPPHPSQRHPVERPPSTLMDVSIYTWASASALPEPYLAWSCWLLASPTHRSHTLPSFLHVTSTTSSTSAVQSTCSYSHGSRETGEFDVS
ncbi:mCG144673, partial [Mus musculus]